LDFHTLLSPQGFVVKHSNGIQDTKLLRVTHDSGFLLFTFKNATAPPQFARRDDSLFNESAKFSSSNDGPWSIFIPCYTNRGIGIEPSLKFSAGCRPHVGRSLSQSGIGFQSHLFQIFKSEALLPLLCYGLYGLPGFPSGRSCWTVVSI
jgi:hypothetical protein